MRPAIRVVVVEDSPTVRTYLVGLLAADPELQVVGTAADGADAVVQVARLRPDVVLMDLGLPVADGYEASRRIMEEVPTPIVMTTAAATPVRRDPAEVGALILVDKPTSSRTAAADTAGRRLVQAVKLMAEVKVVRRWPQLRRAAPLVSLLSSRRVRCVALGASAGGPGVLAAILAPLAPELSVPVFVVQHISAGFTGIFAEWLEQATGLRTIVAEDGEPPRPGTVYIAPERRQLGLGAAQQLRVTESPPVDGFCPSISYLFASVAERCGREAVGVLLTGMGRDGAEGLRRLRQAGGVTIAQDEATCAVFGMPLEAIRSGAAEHVLSPTDITAVLRGLRERP